MENASLVATRKQSNFSWAFLVLPPEQRHGLDVLYAYCREVDDIVDETVDPEEAKFKLSQWKTWIENLPNLEKGPPLALELKDVMKQFGILQSDLLWIIQGVEKDFSKNRYETFSELLEYCDAVASAVGLAALSIFGVPREEAYEYALSTGRALQLTNILRDVSQDFEKNRIYIPLDDMKVFGVTESDISEKTCNTSFKRLMKFEADRAQTFYQDATLAMPTNKGNIHAAEIMRTTYRFILNNLIQKDYDVFQGKIGISFFQKMKIFSLIFAGTLRCKLQGHR